MEPIESAVVDAIVSGNNKKLITAEEWAEWIVIHLKDAGVNIQRNDIGKLAGLVSKYWKVGGVIAVAYIIAFIFRYLTGGDQAKIDALTEQLEVIQNSDMTSEEKAAATRKVTQAAVGFDWNTALTYMIIIIVIIAIMYTISIFRK